MDRFMMVRPLAVIALISTPVLPHGRETRRSAAVPLGVSVSPRSMTANVELAVETCRPSVVKAPSEPDKYARAGWR